MTDPEHITILPEHAQMVRKTLSQQKAKVKTYEALVEAGLPIPPDLKREVESSRPVARTKPPKMPRCGCGWQGAPYSCEKCRPNTGQGG